MKPYLPRNAPSPRPRQPLCGEIACDVCVIGGGICGILTAHLLHQSGLDVVLIEASRLLSGQTRGTTAKITVQHGQFADHLLRTIGHERAQGYVQANLRALQALKDTVQAAGVDCGFEPQSAYLYTCGDTRALEAEALAYQKLGLRGELVSAVPAPLRVRGALRMDNQAQMNPFALLCALAAPLRIYENTRALSLDGTRILTQQGVIRASAIAVCTHYPAFNLPGLYFLRLYQQRSYTLALRPSADSDGVDGMLYGAGSGALSIRSADGCVLVGGESHRCGDADTAGCYTRLLDKARRLFPGSREITRWSAQDCMTMDGVPYVGRLCSGTPDVYAATGFGKWGMTNAMAAAMLLRDEIAGSGSPFAPVFSPQRLPGKAYTLSLLANARHTACDFSRNLAPSMRSAQSLAPGEGAIVGKGLRKVAAYRDMQGDLHEISPYCAHMKCLLRFNPDEKSWDCPCHGSRFTVDGKLICGPAQHGQCCKA